MASELKLALATFAKNIVTGVQEFVRKTDDSDHALHVQDNKANTKLTAALASLSAIDADTTLIASDTFAMVLSLATIASKTTDIAAEDFATEATLSNKFAPILPVKGDFSTAGWHEMAAPASGNAIAVLWVNDQATAALDTGVVEVKWKFDTAPGGSGAEKYHHELTGSQPFSHSTLWRGAANEKLYVYTSSTARVLANADTREFTP